MYKQSNKQFFGNVRQLREQKLAQEEFQKKMKKDDDADEQTRLLDQEQNSQILALDPRDRYNAELEERIAS